MRERLALAVNKALAVVVRDNVLRPPGAGKGFRTIETDQRELAVICHGDAFAVFHGRKDMVEFTASPRTMRRLLGFLLRWWVFGTWCGLKTRLWSWSVATLIDAEQRRVLDRRLKAT